MKKFLHSLVCLLSLALLSTPSFAGDYTNPGFSFSLGGSRVFENFDTGVDEFTFDDSSGVNFKAGYRVTDNFALELDYLLLDGFKGTMYGVEAAKVDGQVFTVCAKLYPFTGPIQPYGLLGIGVADLNINDTLGMGISESESDTVIRTGAGVDIIVSPNLAFFTEISYYLTQGDLEDTDFMPLTAGFKVTF